MKSTLHLATLSLLGILAASAQNVAPEPAEDPVQKAIREFNRRDSDKPNEVTVVLAEPEESEPAEASADEEPVLVTGNAPDEADVVAPDADHAEATDETTPDEADDAEQPEPEIEAEEPKPRKGLAVRVQNLKSGSGSIDPSSVKLRAPFPAKPLAAPPAGWRLERAADTPPFTRKVEISPGNAITLTVQPHILVPEVDGASSFAIGEPGFDGSLGYRQAATVNAILSNSVRQLENDSRNLGTAIDSLQQILVSLPEPDGSGDEPKTKPQQ